ncbi:GMC family oxidoreductase [Marinivivus vitaminiproducens]|uniref:GMC family oxidoreductase n=1 Tax=Marinivivus vitaminiproducens TaxID=3035935 RepID=UPI0027A2DD07|nr:GMC family oxidoreductase N-terminal domain-containing protein [Geminicoccaceae bacterium SCSIO 64248]
MAEYDYIVVGGGSSGCVAAARLVREHGARVLLLEAGGRATSMLVDMPAGFIKFLKGHPYLTMHQPVPQKALGGRQPIVPQGKALGGSSVVNGMVYIRGQADDYAIWDDETGHAGWSFRHMLPYFTKQEGNQRIGGPMHGVMGPLKVSDHIHKCDLSYAFVAALQNIGVPFNPDFNGGRQTGVGFLQLTTHKGRRCSAYRAFLEPVAGDPNLVIETDATVSKVIVEGGRATGVEYMTSGETKRARTGGEVVVAAGAYQTPKLLMLSGIGDPAHLKAHGIAVQVDLPGVGQNLMDHHEVPVIAATNGAYGYHGEDRGLRMIKNGLQWLLFKSGPVTSNGVEACVFINPDDPGADASIQLYCVPTVYMDSDTVRIEPTNGVTLNSCLLRPKARGSVRLRSADPTALPVIDNNYLGHEDDLRLSIAGLRYSREILTAEPLKGMVAAELLPGTGAVSDEELAEHCRRTVKTNYHPCGTCKMGRDDDPMAVLRPDLSVRGVDGLRVIDASMMPAIVSGNTNATALAVGDRAVDLITGTPTLPPAPLANRLPETVH